MSIGGDWEMTDPSVGDLVERVAYRAERSPELAAIVTCDGETVTYRQLLDRAAAIAPRLAEIAGGAGGVTAVCGPGPFANVTILASAIAGVRLLIADVGDPIERLTAVANSVGFPLVSPAEHGDIVDRIDAPVGRHVIEVPVDPPLAGALTGSPDLLVTTSGSTSAPKIAVQPPARWYRLKSADDEYVRRCRLLVAGAGTYGHVSSIVQTQLRGGTSAQFDVRRRSTSELLDFIIRERVTSMGITSTLVQTLLRAAGGGPVDSSLENVNLRGERVTGADLLAAHQLAPAAQVTHMYGSTESSIVAMWYWHPGDPVPEGLLPLYIEDDCEVRFIAPDGGVVTEAPVEPAELLVSNPLVFERYLGVDTSDLFAEIDGKRWFRTGDLVSFDDTGAMFVRGRAGRRVKVGGQFVDLDDVASALEAMPGVAQAAVTSFDEGELVRLVGHLVPERGAAPDPVAVRAELAGRLPVNMVPSLMRVVTDPPTNRSGKLDHVALSTWRPTPVARDRIRELQSPTTAVEGQVLAMARDLLDRPVGLDDDLVDAGMVSIAWVEFVEWLSTEFGVEVELGVLFAQPTVRAIAELVERGRRPAAAVAISRGEALPPIAWAPNGMAAQEPVALARALTDRTVWFPLTKGIGRPGRVPVKVADVVRDHLEAIEETVPAGPIAVAGFSTACHHAQALAAALGDAGRHVPLLVLLDPPAPTSWRSLDDLRTRLRLERDGAIARRRLGRRGDLDPVVVHQSVWIAQRCETLRTRPPGFGGPALVVRTSASRGEPVPAGLHGPVRAEFVEGDHFAAITDGAAVAAFVEDALTSPPTLG